MRCGASPVMACGIVMTLASPVLAQTPPADGLVTVRETGQAVDGASLGFVADGRGNVIAHLGAGVEDVAGEQFLVRVRNQAEEVDRPAEGVAYDPATGLALLRVDGELPAPYRFAGAAAGTGRLVYGATSPPVAEGDGFGVHRGVVRGMEPAPESDTPQPDWVRVSESITAGGDATGSPLFNNCGDVVGVIVDHREIVDAGIPAATSVDWLDRVFGDAGWTPESNDSDCPPEWERIDALVQARVEAAQAGSRERYVAWAMGGVSVLLAVMLVATRRSHSNMKRDKALAQLDLEEARAAVAARDATAAARVPDVLLTGSDEDGARITLRVPGGSIARPTGAVVGRVALDGVFVLDRPEVSRRHLRFFAEEGTLKVEDLDSMNGTLVDGTPLKAGNSVEVKDHALLSLGSVRLAVSLETGAGASAPEGAGEDTGKTH